MIGQQQSLQGQLTPATPPTTTPGSSTQEHPYRGCPSTLPAKQEHASQDELPLFERFRNHMAPHFPFIDIADENLYNDYKRTSPFLFSVILLVADFHSLANQRAAQRAIVELLTRRIFVNNEKSLDLLQGILVLCAWYHPHMFDCPQLTNLVLMAQAMAVDLGLNRSPQQTPWAKVAHYARKPGEQSTQLNRTIEERRAFLGCYYLQAVSVSERSS